MPFDKFKARCKLDWQSAYAKLASDWRRHHARFKRFVEKMKLTCQECRGMGGAVEPVLDDGSGPFEPCGWCEGTGYVTPRLRSLWLRMRREEKARKQTKGRTT
jgi:DnaJ-class molecular chaperone